MKLVQFNILFRQWMRGGVSTAVSLVSLSLGLICSTILLLFAVEEFKAADALTPNPADKYILLTQKYGQEGLYTNWIGKTEIQFLASKFPQIVDYTVFRECTAKWQNEPYNYFDKKRSVAIAATPSFTKYFDIPTVEGNLDSVLAYPDRVALDKAYAARIFPDRNPIGQTMTAVFNYNDTIKRVYTVTAIIDMSKHSMLNFRAIYSYPEYEMKLEGSEFGVHHCAVTLAKGVDPQSIMRQAKNYKLFERGDGMNIRLDPINKAYLTDDAKTKGSGIILKTRDTTSLYIGLTLALVILVIAAFNYINITLTRSASRLKNLAGQRIMGATKWGVRGQIVADTAINVALAILLSLFFLPLSMEGFNSFMDSRISMADLIHPMNALYVMGLLALLIIIPSASLIVKFSIRNPLETFKNPEGRRVRAAQSLVVAQIVVSVTLLTFGINVVRQMNRVSTSIQNSNQVIEVQSSDYNILPKTFLDRVKASASTQHTYIGLIDQYMEWPIKHDDKDMLFHWLQVSPDFFRIFDIKLDEGRIFERTTEEGWLAPKSIVVSRSAVKALGIKGSPIGHKLNDNYTIVGVCPDIRIVNAKTEAKPQFYTYSEYSERYPTTLCVGFKGSVEEKIAEMMRIYKETAPTDNLMPQMRTVAAMFEENNPDIVRMKTMINVFTTISFLLTAFGLFGLSWYMVERRRREIAIRKTYGATVVGMVAMLCRSFLWQSLIAIVIALPAAYFISGYWLEGFVYRVDNAWWVLAVTSAISLVVIFATVIGQTIRAALTNPVKYIKTE